MRIREQNEEREGIRVKRKREKVKNGQDIMKKEHVIKERANTPRKNY
jgi:hypothetical protein